jgi:methylated-DNA-[protein]-cysteine S-methyltransferase
MPTLSYRISTPIGGNEFQRRVWAGLRDIPCGTTIFYGELASRLSNKNAMRARCYFMTS